MPFIPPPPPPRPQNQYEQKVQTTSLEPKVEAKVEKKKNSISNDKKLKILFFFLSALCFACAIVVFTLMFVL